MTLPKHKKKTKIKLHSVDNLELMMQEVYNDANVQINDANRAINELVNSASPVDVNDLTSITKEKGNLMKIKDSSIRIKLELAKLEADMIKKEKGADDAPQLSAAPTREDFNRVRDLIKNKNKEQEEYDI